MNFFIILIVFTIFFSIVLHEYAHGWLADKLGDPTSKEAGRLTLNPLKHIDLFGTILLPGVLIALRLLGYPTMVFGWAKPVPVNFLRLRHPKTDMIWVGMIGPAVNLLLAFIISRIISVKMSTSVFEALVEMVWVNLNLVVLNMIPIPPLDGSRLIAGLLPNRLAIPYMSLERYGRLIIIGLFVGLYYGGYEKLMLPIVDYLGNILGVNFI